MMFGTPIEVIDMARDVAQDLSDSDKILLAIEIILSVTSDAQSVALQTAQRTVERHCSIICHDAPPHRPEVLDQKAVIALRKAPKRVAMSDLYQIAKAHGADERDYIPKSLVAGEAKNAAAARRAYAAEMKGEKPALKDPVEEGFMALLTGWKRAPAAAKRRFVDEKQADIYPMMVSGYQAEAAP